LGNRPALFFHHGWPLSADDCDAQLMFFLKDQRNATVLYVFGL
jgi:hypothetical protein